MSHSDPQPTSQKPLWGILLSVLLALIAYHMPWHVHPAAAFSNNAFDLAEAASLHPTVRAESPTLLTALMLRLPLIGLALMATLTANQLIDERWRWIWRGIAVLIVLRLNPPIGFYPFNGGSENDQQLGMLMFGGLILVGSAILTSRWGRPLYHPLMIVLASAIIMISINGYNRATDVMESLALQLSTGAGILLFSLLLIAILSLTLIEWPLLRRILPSKRSRSVSTAATIQ
jgi:hypothetical protein